MNTIAKASRWVMATALMLTAITAYSGSPARADLIPIGSAASNYAILYEGSGTLNISNDIVNGNIGVSTGGVQFSGNGSGNGIFGQLDFAMSNTGQYSYSSGVGPTSVNYNVTAVTTAVNAINSLSSGISGGTNLNLSGLNGNTVNVYASTGTLETISGVQCYVFNVTAYSANNASVLNIIGDNTGTPVVFNFATGTGNYGNNNVNLGGSVTLSGGLTSNEVLFNFQSSGKNVSLNNNGENYYGIILAPNDPLSATDTNLYGRLFGGAGGDMHVQSGGNIYAPAAVPLDCPWLLMGTSFLVLLAQLRRKRSLKA